MNRFPYTDEQHSGDPASTEAAFRYILNILAGIGFIAAVIAVLIWSVK